jgi:hypothetical protein
LTNRVYIYLILFQLTYSKDIVSHSITIILILRLRVNLCDIYVNCFHYFLYIKYLFSLLFFFELFYTNIV